MDVRTIGILAAIALLAVFVIIKFITGCLPRILIFLVIAAVIGYLVYRFFL